MRLRILAFETKAPSWVDTGRREYAEKINGFMKCEIRLLKSPSGARDTAAVKKKKEGEILLGEFDPKDFVVLFDEAGTSFPNSEEFARQLGRALESGKAQSLFCIGGPYGFDAPVCARANAKWSLSRLTMNHWLAQLMALEQIYRGFTILKNIPYHNR